MMQFFHQSAKAFIDRIVLADRLGMASKQEDERIFIVILMGHVDGYALGGVHALNPKACREKGRRAIENPGFA